MHYTTFIHCNELLTEKKNYNISLVQTSKIPASCKAIKNSFLNKLM